jgi:hypothetical protein
MSEENIGGERELSKREERNSSLLGLKIKLT